MPTTLKSPDELQVLLVEDNPMDVYMIEMVLRECGLGRKATVVDDGALAIALLKREKGYEHCPTPDLVILDLNLKKVDGPEVLDYIRQNNSLKNLCVAILSSSPTDVMFRRAAAANCHFSKPSDVDTYRSLGSRIRECYARHAAKQDSQADA